MRFLLDTNILIAAEPLAAGQIEAGASSAITFIGLANQHGHSLYRHPAARSDIGRHRDPHTKEIRALLNQKYPSLLSPPPIQRAIVEALGHQPEGSNEWVDQCMIAATLGNAVDFLVTEDARLRSRAGRLGLADRVMNVHGAITLLQRFSPALSISLPLVDQVAAHQLDAYDPIFESLRGNYPGFDSWLEKCQREHRTSWVIYEEEIAAVAIVKDETPADFNLPGKTLKICLFKVSESSGGKRYGELLLKPILDYAFQNGYETSYVTVLHKHEGTTAFFPSFGFKQLDVLSELGEYVFAKSLKPNPEAAALNPLDYHIAFGPRYYKAFDAPAFIVPIQPRFHDLLFPEARPQLLPERNPFGNSIRKAYLCHSGTRSIVEGSVLYFYRSHDWRSVTAVGVAEGTLVSSSVDEITRYVGRRTIYTYPAIEEMTSQEVLAILFRQAHVLRERIPARSLQSAGIWRRPSQSITRLEHGGVEWLEANIVQ